MKKEFKLIAYSIFLLALSIVVFSKPEVAKAQEQSTLGVKPSSFLFKCKKGESLNESVKVILTKGNKVSLNVEPDKDTLADCSKLIKNLNLKYTPNDTYGGDMDLNLRIPSDCEDGEYRLVVNLKSTNLNANSTTVNPAINIPIIVQVGNVGDIKFSASNFRIMQYTYGGNTYKNLGFLNLFKGNFISNVLHMPLSLNVKGKTYIDIPEIKQISLYDYAEDNKISLDMTSTIYNLNIEKSVINLNTNKGEFKIDVKSEDVAKDIIRQSETLRTMSKDVKPNLKAILMSIKVPMNPEFSNFNLICGYSVKNSGIQSCLASGKLSVLNDSTTTLIESKDFTSVIVRPGQEKDCTVALPIQYTTKSGEYSLHASITGLSSDEAIKLSLVSYRIYLIVAFCIIILLVISMIILVIIKIKKKNKLTHGIAVDLNELGDTNEMAS